MEFPKNFSWVVLFLVAILVAYAVGKQGQTPTKVSLGGDSGILIEFDKLKNIPQEDLDNRQNELESKLNQIEEEFEENSDNNPNTQFDLSGNWRSNIGLTYIINQFGNSITIQEVHPVYGVTAVGEGFIDQDLVNISYVNAYYVQGQGVLKIYNDRHLEGQFKLATGYRTSTALYR